MSRQTFCTYPRESDAQHLKSLLESHCAAVSLVQVADDHSTREHTGRIYYLSAATGSLATAKRLSDRIRQIEVVSPQYYDFQNSIGLTHSIWVVNHTARNHLRTRSAPETRQTVGSVAQDTPNLDLRLSVLEILRRKDFGELRELIDDCLKGRRVKNGDLSLFTTDPKMLRQYAAILESKLRSSPSSKSIVKRIFEDIAIYEKRGPLLAASRLSWKLLPKGSHPFERVLRHFKALSQRRTHHFYDETRLHKINSLFPDELYIGTDEFEGYAVFYFAQAKTAVLDCPLTGNAIYLFGENWKSLSRLSKSTLINNRRRDAVRIIHTGEWFSRLKSEIATRRLRANLRR